MRLAECLTQGARNGTIPDEVIVGESEGSRACPGECWGYEELQSTWKEWDLVLCKAARDSAGDRVERKRSTQLNLARMDFERRMLYVLSFATLTRGTDGRAL